MVEKRRIAAYILIKIVPGKSRVITEQIAKVGGVKTVHPVTGMFDIIAFIETADINNLTGTVRTKIQTIEGVLRTHTAIVGELVTTGDQVIPLSGFRSGPLSAAVLLGLIVLHDDDQHHQQSYQNPSQWAAKFQAEQTNVWNLENVNADQVSGRNPPPIRHGVIVPLRLEKLLTALIVYRDYPVYDRRGIIVRAVEDDDCSDGYRIRVYATHHYDITNVQRGNHAS